MAVEMLGNTLTTQIGSAMKEMKSVFEKQHQRLQAYSSSDDTCVVGTLASCSRSQNGADCKSSLSLAKSSERGASRSVSADRADCDFTPHGYQTTQPDKPVISPSQRSSHSLTKWSTKPTLNLDSDDSPSKHSVLSLGAGDVDEFDVAAQQFTTMPVPPQSSSPTLAIGDQVDTFYNKYMEEYQPDSLVGPAVGYDFARALNLFFEKTLS